MQASVPPPTIPIGKFKSFGPLGPKYQVGRPVHQLSDGDWLVEVVVIETGGQAEYRLTHLIEDPEAS